MRDYDSDSWCGLQLEGNGPIINERAAILVVSEVKFGLIFDISNLNYPGMYVYIAIFGAYEAMTASKWPRRSPMTMTSNLSSASDTLAASKSTCLDKFFTLYWV